MREILFRGQTRKLGEKVYMTGEKVPGNWVYGGIFQGTGCYSVMYGCPDANDITGATLEKHVVYTDTVGQFTGLTDKNGVKIFEGDIVAYDVNEDGLHYSDYATIVWNENNIRWIVKWHENYSDETLERSDEKEFRVVGNIFDNPEMLKGGADNENL